MLEQVVQGDCGSLSLEASLCEASPEEAELMAELPCSVWEAGLEISCGLFQAQLFYNHLMQPGHLRNYKLILLIHKMSFSVALNIFC